jgi:hypothetical protein
MHALCASGHATNRVPRHQHGRHHAIYKALQGVHLQDGLSVCPADEAIDLVHEPPHDAALSSVSLNICHVQPNKTAAEIVLSWVQICGDVCTAQATTVLSSSWITHTVKMQTFWHKALSGS